MPEYEITYYRKADTHANYAESSRRDAVEFINGRAKAGERLLEIGCGTGNILSVLSEALEYTGLDASPFAVAAARERHRTRTNAEFKEALADTLPFGDTAFDYVVSFFSLEHLSKPRESLNEMVRVLKHGGYLLILAPNLEFPLARPNAIRHKDILYKFRFYLLRFGDYLLRLFGIYAFRTISGNFTEATGKYERIDDDLRYVASTYEVVNYLLTKGLSPVCIARLRDASWRRPITYLPGMGYYGTELNIIMKK